VTLLRVPPPLSAACASGSARLAIHGGSMAGAVSAGCLHASTSDLRFLMASVPLGTPVTIRA
jgi:hypothetical protein